MLPLLRALFWSLFPKCPLNPTSVCSLSYHLFFFQQIFSKCLLCLWHCSRHWGDSEQGRRTQEAHIQRGNRKTANISYSDCDLCRVDKRSREGFEVRDAILDSGQRRRHFNSDFNEVRENSLKAWGKSVLDRRNSKWVAEEERVGCLRLAGRYEARVEWMRKSRGSKARSRDLTGHDKEFGFYSDCENVWTK